MRAVPKVSSADESHDPRPPAPPTIHCSTSGTASPSGCSGGAGVEPRRRSGLRSASAPHIGSTSGPHRPVRWCAHGADDRSGSQERGPSWPQSRKSSKAPTPALRGATYRLPWLRWMSPSSGQRPMATCWRAPTSALKPCWKVCSCALGKSVTSSRSCPTRSSLKVTQS